MSEQASALTGWHEVVTTKDASRLDALLADDIVFRSPAVFKPQEGKALATMYLTAALAVLGPTLRYVHEWQDDVGAVLEFEANVDGMFVHGVDMLRWNTDGKLTNFTVMLRPIRGLEVVIAKMAEQLAI